MVRCKIELFFFTFLIFVINIYGMEAFQSSLDKKLADLSEADQQAALQKAHEQVKQYTLGDSSRTAIANEVKNITEKKEEQIQITEKDIESRQKELAQNIYALDQLDKKIAEFKNEKPPKVITKVMKNKQENLQSIINRQKATIKASQYKLSLLKPEQPALELAEPAHIAAEALPVRIEGAAESHAAQQASEKVEKFKKLIQFLAGGESDLAVKLRLPSLEDFELNETDIESATSVLNVRRSEPDDAERIKSRLKELNPNKNAKDKVEILLMYGSAKGDLATTAKQFAITRKRLETIQTKLRDAADVLAHERKTSETDAAIKQLQEEQRTLNKQLSDLQNKYNTAYYVEEESNRIVSGWQVKGKIPGTLGKTVEAEHAFNVFLAKEMKSEWEKNINVITSAVDRTVATLRESAVKEDKEDAEILNEAKNNLDLGQKALEEVGQLEAKKAERAGLEAEIEVNGVIKNKARIAELKNSLVMINSDIIAFENNVDKHAGLIRDSLLDLEKIIVEGKKTGIILNKYKKEIIGIFVGLGFIAGVTTAGVEIAKTSGVKIGYTGSNTNQDLLAAIEKADVRKVAQLLKKTDPNTIVMNDGTTPLLLAVNLSSKDPSKLAAYISIVQSLLAQGEDVNATDFNFTTPLMEAAKNNNNQMVSLLLTQLNKTPRIQLNSQDINGNTALMFAIETGKIEMVSIFLQPNVILKSDLDLNIQNNQGETALGIAKQLGVTSIITALEKVAQQKNPASTSPSIPVQ